MRFCPPPGITKGIIPSERSEQLMSPLAADLHQFLDDFPRALSAGERRDELRAECQRLLTRFHAATDQHLTSAGLSGHLANLSQALEGPRATALAQYEHLSRSYEKWAHAERKAGDTQAGKLRPLIRARTFFHILMALTAFVCYQFLLTRTGCLIVCGSLLGLFTALEISRRFSPRFNHLLLTSPLFRPIARPEEYFRVNSASYYLLSLSLITYFFSREAVMAAVLILGFADPAAAWLGKRYGKTKLYQRKSVVGSATFLLVGWVVAFTYFFGLVHVSVPSALLAATSAALFGAVVELFSTRFDDNLTVPLAAAIGTALFLR